MRISKKQKEEIDFFCKHANEPFIATLEQEVQYIRETVYGEKVSTMYEMNPISRCKRSFDITIKLWRKDLVNGLLFINELYDDFGDMPFGKKLIDSVLMSLQFDKYQENEGHPEIAFANLIIRNKLQNVR